MRLHQTPSNMESSITNLRTLCVDLDGTLVKSDTLVDSLLVLLRTRPALVFKLPGRLLHGKAAFKAYVTESISLDVAHLPYNRQLLQFLQQERAKGRPIYLATGADIAIARRVAAHLGIFTGVLGSDGAANLTGNKKLLSLRGLLGSAAFDYIGNDTPDLPLLAHANVAMVANPSLALSMELRSRGIRPARGEAVFLVGDHDIVMYPAVPMCRTHAIAAVLDAGLEVLRQGNPCLQPELKALGESGRGEGEE